MRQLFKRSLAVVGSGAVLGANAAADAMITTGITSAGTAFTDNFGAVFAWYIGIVVTLTAGAMLIKYIRRAK